ncbi:LOW QUALITY PROTEIN: putative lysosomal acid lipase/cholesteryl ester hydrolase [Pyrgilauda ruficollis]|uniref:LOW QUALITY PROTEIN: putative lysosomal acid lipase/cholesteryl ester hydrolase n=1 Tax=Pyrgilauda ruficollis TaxID=221976 RepID=UPI001B860FB0|nr:LOW QUALITY PROTEIN: putative lysosomal acid lipase/cholesteryl ester hydrolase [Pyrgilauda ruficollis]
MWLLLVALCLAQGLEDAIPDAEVFHNPERFMNVSQKILFHGYSSEEYEVVTEDGYFLSLNRIPHGKGGAGLAGPRTPVLIVHGFCLGGGDWVDNLPENSLAFILADAGHNVWIGNNRGSSWSRRHRSLSVASQEFWDFSFHEMAMYDLPAMVGFILMQTEQEQLFYIGHAQGSSLGFIVFSSLPHLAKKIKLFFALAPVYTLRHARCPVLKLAFLPDLLLKETFGTRELVVVPRKEKLLLAEKCSRPLEAGVCANSIFLVGGYDRHNLNTSRLDVYISSFPDYTSVKNLLHWGQTAKTAKFKQLDYGLRNMEKYNQLRPPFYQIEAVRVPVALWSGGHDGVTPREEAQRLLAHLTNVVHHEHFPTGNHFNHHWGLNAPQRVCQRIVAMMEENP